MIVDREIVNRQEGRVDPLNEITAIALKRAKERKASKTRPPENKTKPEFFNPAKQQNPVTLLKNALNDVCHQLKARQKKDLNYDKLLSALWQADPLLDQISFAGNNDRIKLGDLEIIKSNLEEIFAEKKLINKLLEPENDINTDCRYILIKLCSLTKRAVPACLEYAKEESKSKSCIIS